MRLRCLVTVVAAASCHHSPKTAADSGASQAVVVVEDSSKTPDHRPLCGASLSVTCFVDTARVLESAAPGEDYPEANWIFFAASGDSIAVSADSGSLVTSLGQEHDAKGATASYFHKRTLQAGVVTVRVVFGQYLQGHSPAYDIRLQRLAGTANSLFRPTGQRAVLTIRARGIPDVTAVIPLAMRPGITDMAAWQVYDGEYRVALLADSLYLVCRKRCSTADTVKLTPGAQATIAY
jgi:hypothetical protein